MLDIGLFCSRATAQSRVRVVSASERDLDPNHYPPPTTSSSTRLNSLLVCSPPTRLGTLCLLLSPPQLATQLRVPSPWCTRATCTLHYSMLRLTHLQPSNFVVSLVCRLQHEDPTRDRAQEGSKGSLAAARKRASAVCPADPNQCHHQRHHHHHSAATATTKSALPRR